MTIKMTQKEIAEWVLDILVNDIKLKPGQQVPDQELKRRYRARNGDAADIEHGLKYADNQEWLSYDSETDMWYLTQAGHEVA